MRGMKIFASLVIVVLLVVFMAACSNNQKQAKTNDPNAAKISTKTSANAKKAEKIDLVEAANKNAAEARKQAQEITGQALPVVTHEIKGDGGMAAVIFGIIVAVILGVVSTVISIFAIRRRGGDEEDGDEGEQEDIFGDRDGNDGNQEQGHDPIGEAGRGVIGIMMSIAAVGLIIALLAPSSFAFSDKKARELATANFVASEANKIAIGALKDKVGQAVETAAAAKGVADKKAADAEAKINKMVADAEAKINKMVADAEAKINKGEVDKNTADIAAIKRDYILQGGSEERKIMRGIVQAAGINLADQPELKAFLVGKDAKFNRGGEAQWTEFYKLMAVARPTGSNDLQKRVGHLETGVAANKTEIGNLFAAIGHKEVEAKTSNGDKITIRVPTHTLASQEFVRGAVSASEEILERKIAENFARMKAVVEGIDGGGNLEKIAKASLLGTIGDVEASLNTFAEAYDRGWVNKVLESIPASAGD